MEHGEASNQWSPLRVADQLDQTSASDEGSGHCRECSRDYECQHFGYSPTAFVSARLLLEFELSFRVDQLTMLHRVKALQPVREPIAVTIRVHGLDNRAPIRCPS